MDVLLKHCFKGSDLLICCCCSGPLFTTPRGSTSQDVCASPTSPSPRFAETVCIQTISFKEAAAIHTNLAYKPNLQSAASRYLLVVTCSPNAETTGQYESSQGVKTGGDTGGGCGGHIAVRQRRRGLDAEGEVGLGGGEVTNVSAASEQRYVTRASPDGGLAAGLIADWSPGCKRGPLIPVPLPPADPLPSQKSGRPVLGSRAACGPDSDG